MSGSGTLKRQRALAIRASKLADEGRTHREIAELVGKQPEQIKGLVTLGERLRQLTPSDVQ